MFQLDKCILIVAFPRQKQNHMTLSMGIPSPDLLLLGMELVADAPC